jgi:phospholipase/carboxylesterase
MKLLRSGHELAGAAGAMILMHGRGGSAEDIISLAAAFDFPGIAYLAPEAAGHAWYPYSFLSPLQQNEPALTAALERVAQVVDDVTRAGIPREKLIIAGFSQGACLASEYVARNPAHFGGLIAFTGGLIGPPGTTFQYAGSLEGTRAFFGSGDPDAHVPWQRVQETANILGGMGAEVTLKRYPGMPHTVSREEIEQAKKLIAAVLG